MEEVYADIFGGEARPNELIVRFVSIMGKEENRRNYRKGEILIDLSKENPFLHLIKSGKVGIYRRSDRLLIQEIPAPWILGLAYMFHKTGVVILAHSEVVAYKIPREQALADIDKNGLWRDVAAILAWVTRSYTLRDASLVGLDAYQIIRHHLNLLVQIPIEERFTITAAKFITDRTFISRSRVMEILKQLNLGGYITIKNGILINISRLPDDF